MSAVSLVTSILVLTLVTLNLCHGASVKWKISEDKLKSSPLQDALLKKVTEQQETKEVPMIPLIQWGRKKGLYHSGVRLNFHGSPDLSEIRRLLSIYDNNMFVTAWVTSQLIESALYEGAPLPTASQLHLAIEAIGDYHDHNVDYKTSVMTFWPQNFNETAQYYQSTPTNLVEVIKMSDKLPMAEIEKFLNAIGLKALAKQLESLMKQKDSFLDAFHIPPDFDDTFVNLGLGSLLYRARKQFPSAWAVWASQNTNVSSVFDALKKYPYRPFSDNSNLNSVDPRTYYWTRDFLTDAKKTGKDVALVSTWVQNIEELRKVYNKGVVMPFRTNNVDATVAANTIFGITSAVLSGLVEPSVLDDPMVAQIYHNTSALITFAIMNNMSDRADLALTYYPSRIEFYWFVARTYDLMSTARSKGPLPRPVMEEVYQMLMKSLKTGMTKYVLTHGKSAEAHLIYYEDFLGNADIDILKRPVERGEDRIFTTAMAINALLYTWTSYNDTLMAVQWRPDTPSEVKETVYGAIGWLSANVLSDKHKPWNAFFSGSVKTFLNLPFWYPANQFEYLNGTAIQNRSAIPQEVFVLAMQKYMSPDQYDAELKKVHFGLPTPQTFDGYNVENGYFPFWSSEPYTYSTALIALTRYNSLRG